MPAHMPFWHFHLPYKMERIDNPFVKNLYLPLNRLYKPVGVITGGCVDYRGYLDLALAFAMPLKDDEPFWNRRDDGSVASFYLYNDGNCRDFAGYAKRLGALMSRKHKAIGDAGYRSGAVLNRKQGKWFPSDVRGQLLDWAKSAGGRSTRCERRTVKQGEDALR